MRCKQARRELALWVGGDHDPRLYPLLESHLESCPECRAFAREMKNSLDPLRAVSSMARLVAGSPASSSGPESVSGSGSAGSSGSVVGSGVGWSLWPAVRSRLARRRVPFSDLLDTPVSWVPVSGLTVACLTLFVVIFNTSNIPQGHQLNSGFDAPMGQPTPVNYPFGRGGFSEGPLLELSGPRHFAPSNDVLPLLDPRFGVEYSVESLESGISPEIDEGGSKGVELPCEWRAR